MYGIQHQYLGSLARQQNVKHTPYGPVYALVIYVGIPGAAGQKS